MTVSVCRACGQQIRSKDETCPQCGALTPYGEYREWHHAHTARSHAAWQIPVLVALGILLLVLVAALILGNL